MAKRKKRRRTSRSVPPAARQYGAVRPDREERREAARRQRETLRRRAARRRAIRVGLIASGILAAIATITVYAVSQGQESSRRAAAQSSLLRQAKQAAKTAGCTGIRKVPPYPGPDQGHIGADVPSPPPLTSYPSHPLASGPHDVTPLDAGVYDSPPDIYQATHSLEHGAAEVWYAPGASGPELTRLTGVLDGEDHVIVAPYRYAGPSGVLPRGREMALVAWHRMQLCDRVSAAAAVSFVHSYRYDPGDTSLYKGEAPEAGAPI
jgi:type II secretory pathway pseudopilin PulG